MKTHKGLIRSHVKGKYGQFYLVQTTSGRWVAVWWCFVDGELEDAFRAIVTEDADWFENQSTFAQPPSHFEKKQAIEEIIDQIENELQQNQGMADAFEPDLAKARRALRKASLSLS